MSELHKFIFDGEPVRGLLVRLTDDWCEVLGRRAAAGDAFAEPVRTLLGEMAAATVLMQANIKFDGALVLQIHGDGPVKLAVAEVQSSLAFRVTAKVVGEVAADASFAALVDVHGKGRCAITLDPAAKLPRQQPYQGVVALDAGAGTQAHGLAAVLEHYMLQSEQLETRLILAANDKVAAGLLIQRLPTARLGSAAAAARARADEPIGVDESYNRIAHLAATLSRDELLTLDAETVLRRLFWDEKLLRFEPQSGAAAPRFACSCSRERVGNMLKSLGRDEVDDIVAEQGRVEVDCDFCGARQHFDSVDVGRLFTPQRNQAPGSAALN